MEKYITLLLILVTLSIYSQKTKTQVLSLEDNNPIENALIYYDSVLIDKTNNKGFFEINLKKHNKISIVKEDYYDTIISLDSSDKVFLRKINAIQLKEVVVTKANVFNLLDSIGDSKKRLKNVIFSNHTHFYNILTIDKDTLLYLNNRLYLKNREGYFCSQENKIIGNFKKTDNLSPIFEHNNEQIVFNYNYLHYSNSYLTMELLVILKFRKLFEYKVSKDDGYYKIEFSPNKNNKEFPYYGYILIDDEDYGIYEFSCKTTSNEKNKRNLVLNDKIINYKILNEESFIKHNKNENNKYELVTYRFDSQLKSLDGYFKGSIITNKYRKEPTFAFDASKAKKIDLTTYKIIY
ncbi:hypothetical protein ACFSX9_06070 [Flavobacterium ardleyense]|uniref:Carboxypeptidase-like regulatory domain-containing protein n=1 Tax=Flavobacterium ardleyense TaxID=2038737 RepID=A0ABW5Z928_9FLAO